MGELEHVAVENEHELLPSASLAHGVGQLAHAVGHFLLLKVGEIDHRLLLRRVAEGSAGRGVARLG